MHELKALALAAICAFTGTGSAAAQTPPQPEIIGWSIVPAIQLAGIYENSVRFTTVERTTEGGFLTFVPSLEARHRGPLGTFNAGYSFNSEKHTEQFRSLDDMLARQLGVIGFESRPSTRSSVTGMARYMATRRPEEVLDPTGLAATDRHTTSFLTNFGVDHSVTPALRVKVNYTGSVDDYGRATELRPGARNTLHSLVVGMARQHSPRTTIGVEYGAKFLIGEEFTADTSTRGMFWANILGVRVTRSFTPRVSATVLAGPRAAQVVPSEIARTATTPVQWEFKPEVQASLTFRTATHVVTVGYASTQFLGVGASGLIDTKSLELTAGARLGHRVRLSTRPGFYQNSLAGLKADAYRFDATASFQTWNWISIDAIYGYRHQNRSLALTDFAVTAANRSKTRNRLVVGVTIRRPIQM